MKDTAYEVEGLIEEGEAFRSLSSGPAHAAPVRAERGVRAFHTGMAVAFLVTTFAGFAPSYFLRGLSQTPRPPLSPLLHVHGLVFTSWLLLLFVQSALVAGHRVDWHRRLGIFGAVLAAVMVPFGIAVGIDGARHGLATKGPEALTFLIFPLGQIAMFAALVGGAIWMRKTPDVHRRLILLSTVVVITPAISRLPFGRNPMVSLLLATLFVVAAMIHDWKSRGRVHAIYVWGALAILLSGPVRFALGHTHAWQSFASWLVK
jgi:hypothetical protein